MDGVGVIESDATPGGCWVHYSAIDASGRSQTLMIGESVQFEFESAKQDGFDYRAVLVERDH